MILEVPEGHVGGALFDRPHALRAPGPLGIRDVEADKGRGGVNPALRLHQVGEDPDHPVGSWRHARRLRLQDVVDVASVALASLLLGGVEGVSEPSHRRARCRSRSPRSSTGQVPCGRASAAARAGRSAARRAVPCAARNCRRRTVKRPGSVTPMPTRLSCVSAPPTTTGVPSRRPVAAAACGLTAPIAVPGPRTAGNTRALEAAHLDDGLGPVAFARSNIPELDPSDGSVTCTPHSRCRIQSPSMPT